ncbi:hypothetical protein D9619_009621 [Psilocybe cf. subviscida]|uniref:Uncharacterized protein n=1 Tax=Psilocybe cf. subviscida TaxID=2480587 RepID=A0A8H5BM93_9AGAR|nr:hypothetical protein D9619_009621 [Psilocybe cf. subviscida]
MRRARNQSAYTQTQQAQVQIALTRAWMKATNASSTTANTTMHEVDDRERRHVLRDSKRESPACTHRSTTGMNDASTTANWNITHNREHACKRMSGVRDTAPSNPNTRYS